MFKLGLIINPVAGVGGALALKGSDGVAIQQQVAQGDIIALHAPQRALTALKRLNKLAVCVYCFDGLMGAQAAEEAGLNQHIIGAAPQPSTAHDTKVAAKQLADMSVDLLVFVGGDGTARDIFSAVGTQLPVLGIPAGVKMHSGVYAVSPQAAGDIIVQLIRGQLIDIGLAEVRDIDENEFRAGRVSSRFYGELLVPKEGRFLQQVKQSGREVEALVIQDIAADIVESMDDHCLYLIGPGTTPQAIMSELNLHNTLLGVDAIYAGKIIGVDLSEVEILSLLDQHLSSSQSNSPAAKIIITAIGGQGHILGRGNQQFSPTVIRKVGIDNIILVATKTKITQLQGRPLLVDTNDPLLDAELVGYRQVITGYHDTILYPISLDQTFTVKE